MPAVSPVALRLPLCSSITDMPHLTATDVTQQWNFALWLQAIARVSIVYITLHNILLHKMRGALQDNGYNQATHSARQSSFVSNTDRHHTMLRTERGAAGASATARQAQI